MVLTASTKKNLMKGINKLDSNKVPKKVKGAINAIISKSSSLDDIRSRLASEYSDYISYWSKVIGVGG